MLRRLKKYSELKMLVPALTREHESTFLCYQFRNNSPRGFIRQTIASILHRADTHEATNGLVDTKKLQRENSSFFFVFESLYNQCIVGRIA